MLKRLRQSGTARALLALLLAAYILPGNAFFCVHGNGSSSVGRHCACDDCRELKAEIAADAGCSGDCCVAAKMKHAEAAQSVKSDLQLSSLSGHTGECCSHFGIGLLGHAAIGKLRAVQPALLFTAPALDYLIAELPSHSESSAASRGSPPPPTDTALARAAALLLL